MQQYISLTTNNNPCIEVQLELNLITYPRFGSILCKVNCSTSGLINAPLECSLCKWMNSSTLQQPRYVGYGIEQHWRRLCPRKTLFKLEHSVKIFRQSKQIYIRFPLQSFLDYRSALLCLYIPCTVYKHGKLIHVMHMLPGLKL